MEHSKADAEWVASPEYAAAEQLWSNTNDDVQFHHSKQFANARYAFLFRTERNVVVKDRHVERGSKV